MSRYGRTSFAIPKGVEVKQDKARVIVKGPRGELFLDLKPGVTVVQEEGLLSVSVQAEHIAAAEHGLYRSLLENMVLGVSSGFQKKLILVGVGYRAAVMGQELDLQLGFSHPQRIPVPKTLKVEVDKSTTIIITGSDKQEVGQFAATVRAVRPPEPYKGKGVRYEGEKVRKKAGKAGKGKG